jgi:hypothetical protein
MSEMIEVICPVCCAPVCCAHVAHDGRIIRVPAAEFAKCTRGNVRDCIELWRAWKTALIYQAVSEAARFTPGPFETPSQRPHALRCR